NILDRIITRGHSAEGRIAQFTVRLKDRPGSLLLVLDIIKNLEVNILDIAHHRFKSAGPFGFVDVSITLETRGPSQIEEIRKVLEQAGYPPCDAVCDF
ncbi:MAG TPA: threonine ammonia-lyase, partial [Thermodesulfobacteriota bacterium]|nr:threonine ammonia-lyase [Thermodesulfobacteriota bacterium]